jgi:hypothetical protein
MPKLHSTVVKDSLPMAVADIHANQYRPCKQEYRQGTTQANSLHAVLAQKQHSVSSWDGVFDDMSPEGLGALTDHLQPRVAFCTCNQSYGGCGEDLPTEFDIADAESTDADFEDTSSCGSLAVSSDGDDFGCCASPSMDLNIPSVPIVFSWKVNARKFCTKKHQVVSPAFDICEQTSFRIILKPTSSFHTKQPTSFLKSSGCGSIEFELVDMGGSANVSSVSILIGKDAKQQPLHRPRKVDVDFEDSSICRLGDEWNFLSSANLDCCTVLFSIEVFVRVPMSLRNIR